MNHRLLLIFSLLLSPFLSEATKPFDTQWTVKNPFEQKVFIENKGQYGIPGKLNSTDILFGATLGGLQYYFTNNAIWIERVEKNKSPQQPISGIAGGNSEEVSANNVVENLYEITFSGFNPSASITGYDEVSANYNFSVQNNLHVKSSGFKKLVYKNIYPNIDMEFYFPEDKQGFEYDFIVHPGGDVAQIKMQYPLNNGISISEKGNVVIQTLFGAFTDHAPIAKQQNSSVGVSCVFSLINGMIQFNTGDYNKSETLIIDPWTSVPVFPNSQSDRAYDIDWDNAGNCYVYGGSGQYSAFPLYLLKYNNTGKLLWRTEIKDYYAGNYGTELYGDFAVDRNSQSVYVSQGANVAGGAKILKLNSSGMIIDSSAGISNMIAMWRIAFSQTYNELVAAGGNYPNYPAVSAMYIDTGLTTPTPVYVVNPANPYYYMWGLALDNNGNCYMALSGRDQTDTASNWMYKVPMPSLAPNTWRVNDGYEVQGIVQPQYLAHNNGNGFNGITVSDTNLFTYDSYTLKKWSTLNGKLLASLNINGDSTKLIYWSGLASNNCGYIFLGSHDSIKKYDVSLNLIDFFVAPDSVYDISLGNNNILYACGAGFVTSVQLDPIKTINKFHNASCSSSTGSDTILISGGTPPYSVTWSNTQTDTVLNNLSPGTYSVTITDNSCSQVIKYDSIKINSFMPVQAGIITALRDTICEGTSGYLILSGSTGSSIQWQSSFTNSDFTDVNAIDTVKYKTAPLEQSTWYRVIVNTSSCSDSSVALRLYVPPALTASFIESKTGAQVTFNSSGSSGDISSYFWDFGDGQTSNSANPSQTYAKDTIYNVCLTIYDGSNCSYTFCREVDLIVSGIATVDGNKELNIYPDPVSNELYIDGISNNNKITDLLVYNVLGKVVISKMLNDMNANPYQLDVSLLPKGIYFLKIKTIDVQFMQKIVKQ